MTPYQIELMQAALLLIESPNTDRVEIEDTRRTRAEVCALIRRALKEKQP